MRAIVVLVMSLKFAPSIRVRTQPENAAYVTLVLQSECRQRKPAILARMAPTLAALWSRHTARPHRRRMVRSRQRSARGQDVLRAILFECAAKPATDIRFFPSGHEISQNKRVRVGVDPRVLETNSETNEDDRTGLPSSLRRPRPRPRETESRHDSHRSTEAPPNDRQGAVRRRGRSHIGQMQAQRFSDGMIGMPN